MIYSISVYLYPLQCTTILIIYRIIDENKKNMNLLRRISFYRIGKFFTFIGFIYQFIDSTITYCEFETIFDLKEGLLTQKIPLISFCIDSYEEYMRIKQNKRNDESFGEYIHRSTKVFYKQREMYKPVLL